MQRGGISQLLARGGISKPFLNMIAHTVFTHAIVRPPSWNFAAGLTTADLGVPVYERALEQHQAYCQALKSCGLVVTSLSPDEDHPDSTFVEDTAVLTPHCAVTTRPGAPTRIGEVESVEAALREYYPKLETIHSPGTLDGGDVCEAGDQYFIGISVRTNEEGAMQLAQLLKSFGYTSGLIDIRGLSNILHLKSGISYIGDNRLVVIKELKDFKEFSGFELIHVNSVESYAANCLMVNDRVLIATGFSVFQEELKKLGYETTALEMSEFQKMDGGLSCLSLRF